MLSGAETSELWVRVGQFAKPVAYLLLVPHVVEHDRLTPVVEHRVSGRVITSAHLLSGLGLGQPVGIGAGLHR